VAGAEWLNIAELFLTRRLTEGRGERVALRLADRRLTYGELAGAVPDGVGSWAPARFREHAGDWLVAELYGTFDPAGFVTVAV